jgi:hypothetical protein
MANDQNILGTVVIDVLLSLYLTVHPVANLFPFPLTPAQLLTDGLPIRGCAANCWQHFAFKNIFLFAAPLFSRFTDHLIYVDIVFVCHTFGKIMYHQSE